MMKLITKDTQELQNWKKKLQLIQESNLDPRSIAVQCVAM